MSAADYWKSGFPIETVEHFLRLVAPLENTEIGVECRNYFRRYALASNLKQLSLAEDLKTLHVGASWSGTPRTPPTDEQHKLDAAAPTRRAFVIDVDLQDYPLGISKHDQSGNDRALPIVLVGMEVLKFLLQDAFGFKETFVFYSGRRGAHLYVVDERAVQMSDEARSAVASFFTFSADMTSGRIKARDLTVHPNFSRVFEMCKAVFVATVVQPRSQGGVGLLDSEDGVDRLLLLLDTRGLPNLRAELLARDGGCERWVHIESSVGELARRDKMDWVKERLTDVILSFTWPRADMAVSAKMNHLLKIPFGAHFSTGRVAVPVMHTAAFSPLSVPTVQDWTSLPALVREFKDEIDRLVRTRKEQSAPPPAAQERDDMDVDIEDLTDGAQHCVLQFQRALFARKEAEGAYHLATQLRAPGKNRRSVLWLNDSALADLRTRAEAKVPTKQDILGKIDALEPTSEFQKLCKYNVYLASSTSTEHASQIKHTRLLERMHSQPSSEKFTEWEAVKNMIASAITPAWILPQNPSFLSS